MSNRQPPTYTYLQHPALRNLLGSRHPQRVVLITLPDNVDLPYWLQWCREEDEAANHAFAGRSSDPDTALRTVITYPELRGVRDAVWVYVAWHGLVRCRHRAYEESPLELADLRLMDPPLAARMRLGEPYLWVDAEWERTPPWSVPQPARSCLYGLLSGPGLPGVEPRWL